MPHSFLIVDDLDLAYMRYSGHVTLRDERALTAFVLADPNHRPDMPKLSDASGMVETDISLSGLIWLRDRLTAAYADVPGPVLWAHYAPSELSFGMARMWQMLMDDIAAFQSGIFARPEAALEFLGLNRPGILERLDLSAPPDC